MVECSESKDPTTHKSTMATTLASNYWTAMAFFAMHQLREEEGTKKYTKDDCGVKCFVTADRPNDMVPVEPYCANCGYPPQICEPYFTRCTGTKLGRWFNEAEGKWIEAEKSPEEEEAERWNQHKFGLCPICKVGLDDKSEFTFNYANGSENGTMMCWGCDAKRKPKQTCSGCLAAVEDKDILVATWDMRSRKNKVVACSGCCH
jgi:hypothetical protein